MTHELKTHIATFYLDHPVVQEALFRGRMVLHNIDGKRRVRNGCSGPHFRGYPKWLP